jgi:hypothetical protein
MTETREIGQKVDYFFVAERSFKKDSAVSKADKGG